MAGTKKVINLLINFNCYFMQKCIFCYKKDWQVKKKAIIISNFSENRFVYKDKIIILKHLFQDKMLFVTNFKVQNTGQTLF